MKTFLILSVFMFQVSSAARAAVSSGGKYIIDRSAVLPGAAVEGGSISVSGSLSEFYPVTGDRVTLNSGLFALYDGFLGRKLPNSRLVPGFISVSDLGWINVPAGALSFDYEVYARINPQASPLRVKPSVITSANSKIEGNRGEFSRPLENSTVEINFLDDSGNYRAEAVPKNITLTLAYKDNNHDGILDGTMPPVRAATLSAWVLDEQKALWVRMPSASVNTSLNTVNYPVYSLGVYSLFGAADTRVDEVYAYPVPWRPNAGNPEFGTLEDGITFTNLPTEGTIKIFNLAGELVKTIEIPKDLFPARLKWEVRNNSGENVVSGVYIWQVSSGSNRKSGKLMVIR